MFIRRLMISCEGEVIRDIPFKKGMNLIIDETRIGASGESGNNVGKTTVLRLVNYCFGSKAEKIYSDPEFKGKSDPAVQEYLEAHNVIIRIDLARNLDFSPSDDLIIERNFLKRASKVQKINGEHYSNDEEFKQELKRMIFGSEVRKPTIKQIIAKNIREGGIRTENAVKVLDPHATASEYELLYLFWLGIEVQESDQIAKLEQSEKAEVALLKRLDKDASISQIEQALAVLSRRIESLEKKKENLNIDPEYNANVDALNETRMKVSSVSSTVSALDMRRSLIEESLAEIEKEKSSVNVDSVRSLYEQTHSLIPSLQKTFEETLAFHNAMIESKRTFVARRLPDICQELKEAERELEELREREGALKRTIAHSGTFKEFDQLIAELNDAYEKKGHYEADRDTRESAQSRLESIQAQLRIIKQGIKQSSDLIEQRIERFNKIFAALSYRVYGEEFILSTTWNKEGKLGLVISSVGNNMGTGKKLGQIALFDLSYIRFADAEGIECLHFVMQDRIENMHDNQILDLQEIVDETNCQYIVAVLKDKLPVGLDVEDLIAIRLSQEDKLLRIERERG